MKILMIGPSKSDSQNYGLGLATENIAKQLSTKADLTIVSPVHASQMTMNHQSEQINVVVEETLLDAKSVDASAVQINVETMLTPYFYHHSKEESKTEVTDAAVLIQEALKTYNHTVIKEVASLDYDVIYAHDWLSIGAALQLKEKYGKPMVLHIHALDYDRVGKKTDSWVYKIEKEGMEKADIVIAVSNYHADIMNKFYGIDKKKIKVVHLASQKVDPAKYSSPFDQDIILFAGRLSQQKGVFTFIDIASELIKNHDNVRFVVAGDGELSQEVVSKVNEKGLAAHFNFTGLMEREALHALMKESKVMVMPSVSEPFGLVAMEAAINELAIVVTPNCGSNEVLKGSLIPENDTVAGYIRMIEKVLVGKDSVSKGIAKNKEAASNRSWEIVGEEIFQLMS